MTTKDWFFLRIEENSNSTLQEIKHQWHLEECVDMHLKLDAQARAKQIIHKEQVEDV